MREVMVLAEARRGELRPVSFELIGAARALCEQGAGEPVVALIGPDAEAQAGAVSLEGVQRVLVVPTPQAHFEAHVAQAAVEALIEQRRPSLVLAGHTIDSLGFAPAVAARGEHGFAGDVTSVSWREQGALAQRPAYGEELIAELDFPGKETVILLLRPGAFEPTAAAEAGIEVERVELDLATAARSERVELREAPSEQRDIAKADFLLALGRGIGSADSLPRLERLAEAIGATVSVSGPLVEAGWASRTRKVGQSGKTVAPRVYLALGISGAAQHLAGMSRSRTIVAVNSDPGARIFDFAHYGAVADLFEIADELERLSA
ncbi:MAG TPA: electron transfer flavoprotein subunit alpha/FixB family protein [Solirubrobacteraceae bacterium]|nr:electron transfer flavoprotein subunit alpha/FixB family protein [Solirubrobacteraceae bacterium]